MVAGIVDAREALAGSRREIVPGRFERVVYFVDHPYGPRDRQRFGVDVLSARGIPTEVWDLTPFRWPDVERRVVTGTVELGACRRFTSREDFEAACATLDERSLVISCLIEPLPLSFFGAAARPVPFCVIAGAWIPVPPAPSFLEKLRRTTPSRLAKALSRRVLPRPALRPAAAVVASGENTFEPWREPYALGPATEVVWTHALDYDLYLKVRAEPVEPGPPTAVYLDNNGPFAQDFVDASTAPPMTEERWYPTLRRLFDRVERERGVRVVIAAHPRSSYDAMPDLFGGRRVIRGETASLVRRSSLVINTCSTAFSFAALFRKPTVFITTAELEDSRPCARYYVGYVRAMAKAAGKSPLDIEHDAPIDWARELSIDEAAYERYVRTYLKKPGTPDEPIFDIFARWIAAGAPPGAR
jgi:hypothetical protein